MDLSNLFQKLQESLGSTLPSLLGAVAILLIGWIVAIIVRAALRKGLGAVALDERVEKSTGRRMSVERAASQGAFYLIMVFVLLAFFNALKLEAVSGSLQELVDQMMAYAPKILAAGVLLLVAWIVAVIVRAVVTAAIAATGLDEKVGSNDAAKPLSGSLGTVAYGLILLLFLPGVLGALEMNGLLGPVQGMVDMILGMVPRILAAAAIGLVGWFLARIVRDIVVNILAATGADKLGERAGMGTLKISKLVGIVVYVFILVPAIVSALNALEMQSISDPASQMLTAVMAAIPNVFAAAMIVTISWFVARLVGTFVTGLLSAMNCDVVPEKIGLASAFAGETTLSKLAGHLVVAFIMLFAATEAAGRLGFEQVSGFVTAMTAFGGQVLLGLAIIGVGLWLSNLASKALEASASNTAARVVQFAILGIVFAMGLRAMGLADEIVNLAFGLTLGALAVAAALAFGLGGREAAGKQLGRWMASDTKPRRRRTPKVATK